MREEYLGLETRILLTFLPESCYVTLGKHTNHFNFFKSPFLKEEVKQNDLQNFFYFQNSLAYDYSKYEQCIFNVNIYRSLDLRFNVFFRQWSQ